MIPGYCFYVCDWDGAGKGQMIYDTYLFLRLKFFFLFWKDGRKGVGGRVNLVYSVSFLLRHNSIFYHFGDKVFFFFFFLRFCWVLCWGGEERDGWRMMMCRAFISCKMVGKD